MTSSWSFILQLLQWCRSNKRKINTWVWMAEEEITWPLAEVAWNSRRNAEQITKPKLPVYMYCTSDDNSAWLFTSNERNMNYITPHTVFITNVAQHIPCSIRNNDPVSLCYLKLTATRFGLGGRHQTVDRSSESQTGYSTLQIHPINLTVFTFLLL